MSFLAARLYVGGFFFQFRPHFGRGRIVRQFAGALRFQLLNAPFHAGAVIPGFRDSVRRRPAEKIHVQALRLARLTGISERAITHPRAGHRKPGKRIALHLKAEIPVKQPAGLGIERRIREQLPHGADQIPAHPNGFLAIVLALAANAHALHHQHHPIQP